MANQKKSYIKLLVSLHIPKTAGSSFYILLKEIYKNALIKDNSDFPLNFAFDKINSNAQQFSDDLHYLKRLEYHIKGVKCIHGHFLIKKYQKFKKNKNNVFITWVREPLERMESHYNYWFRTFDDKKTKAPFHRRIVTENWSFEEFCFSKQMQNIYFKLMYDFPIKDFDFIGITENFNEDVTYFMSTFLNADYIEIPKKNVNPFKIKNKKYDDSFLERFKSFHFQDYEIYNYAIERRKKDR